MIELIVGSIIEGVNELVGIGDTPLLREQQAPVRRGVRSKLQHERCDERRVVLLRDCWRRMIF
jgi:hypothetical protein